MIHPTAWRAYLAARRTNRGFVTTVTRTLAATGLPARRLELEITEAVLMRNDEGVIAMLQQLRSLGVRIAMDDFGTGYSSLNYLRNFPFDKIKIDRCFMADADRNRGGAAIVQAIATLGASLGVETTAEILDAMLAEPPHMFAVWILWSDGK